MGEYRCILLATVLKVYNSIPLYPYCQRCYSKLDESKKQLWQCSQCSNMIKDVDVTYRFRLSMSIADRQGVADVSIFGQCLDNIFGSTANNFQKYLKHVEDSHPEIDPNFLLQSAETNSLTGNQFYFGFKVLRKTGINIRGLDDLVEQHSRTNKPRSIVACQAIQPFQSAQNLTIIQYVKHMIHCSKSTNSNSSCSSALCYCKCSHEINNRKQSFKKNSTFLCSGSSAEFTTQRKLATKSLVLSYEESVNASNSQRSHSQSSTVSVDALEQSLIESSYISEFHEPEDVWEDGFHSCSLKNGTENLVDSFMFINNFTIYDDNKSVYQHGDDQAEIKNSQDVQMQQDSTFSVKYNVSTTFPDDLPFSEDLELFLEKVDARHAEGNIPDASPNAKELSMKIISEICSQQHSHIVPIKSTWILQKPLDKPLDNAVSQIRESNFSNLPYLNELPFSEDFQIFLHHLESKHDEETAVSFKPSPLPTLPGDGEESFDAITNKENNMRLLCRREHKRGFHFVGSLSRLKRHVVNHNSHCSGIPHHTLQPCRFSTPIYPVPFRRTGFRKSCKRRLQHQIKTDLTIDSHQQNSLCNTSNSGKEASHKKLVKASGSPQNSALGDTLNRSLPESVSELASDLPVVNNCTFDLFSSQSLIFSSSVKRKDQKSLKKRTTSLSNDLMERRLQSKQAEENETQMKLSHKSHVMRSANKNTEPNHSYVCQTFDVKPDGLNTSDILTQQLFDSSNDASSDCSFNFETVKNVRLQNKKIFPVNRRIQRYSGNYMIEGNPKVPTFHSFAKDLKDHPTIKDTEDAISLGIIEPLSKEMASYHSPDLFSQSLFHSSSKLLENQQFCKTPDLFSSWCDDSHPSRVIDDASDAVDNGHHASQSIRDCDGSLSMQLFSSFEDNSDLEVINKE